jgi:hypothetical protein
MTLKKFLGIRLDSNQFESSHESNRIESNRIQFFWLRIESNWLQNESNRIESLSNSIRFDSFGALLIIIIYYLLYFVFYIIILNKKKFIFLCTHITWFDHKFRFSGSLDLTDKFSGKKYPLNRDPLCIWHQRISMKVRMAR